MKTLVQVVVSICLGLLVLWLDVKLPLGMASGAFCVFLVAVSLWCSARRRDTLLLAAACSLLMVPGYFFLPTGDEFWQYLFTRLLILIALWCLVVFGLYVGQPSQRLASWPMIGQIAYLGLTICFFVLAALWVARIWSYARERDQRELARRVELTRSAIAQLLSAVHDTDAAQWSYLLSGEDRYLGTYQKAQSEVKHDIRELRKLTADDRSQSQRLNDVEPLIAAKVRLQEQKIETRRTAGLPAAIRLADVHQQWQLMEAIRGALWQMDQQQEMLLQQHAVRIEKGARFATATRFLGLSTTFVTALLVVIYLSRNAHAHQQLAESLAESEHRLTLATEGTSLGIWDWDVESGDVFWYASLFKRLLGYSEHDEEFPDQFEIFERHLHPDDRGPTVAAIRRHLEHDAPFDVEFRLQTKSGDYCWFRARGKASRDADGKPYRMSGSIQDVTDQKQSREQLQHLTERLRDREARLRAIVDTAADGILTFDHEGLIESFNPAAERLFQISATEAIGRHVKRFMMPLTDQEHDDYVQRALSTSEHETIGPLGEVVGKRKDGSEFPLELSVSEFRIGSQRGFTGIVHDVTDRKRAEATLARRAAELRRSNEELEQYVYVASHDLKEPLRMVASYTGLLAEEYEGLLDETGKKYIHYATDGAKRMQALIDDLLTYSRVGRNESPPQRVDLNQVLDTVRANLALRLRDSAGVLEVDELPTVAGSPTLFLQLIQNLVANAIKFHGDEPPLIHVSCRASDDEYLISVQDNGIGIAPEYHQRIFQVFQRLHSRSEYEGTGIGLAICKKIIERLGGRIWVESRSTEGSTFAFTLPRDQCHIPVEKPELVLT